MKKLILSLALLASFVSASFAENIFAHRFFEIKVDVPVEVSNNIIGITDIMQQHVVIDLEEIANNVKDKGAAIKGNVAPSVKIGIDIPRGLILGVNVGAEADVGVGLSDDLFEFLGKGNTGMGNEFKIQTKNTYADVFTTVAVNGGWNTKKSRIEFVATAFSALAHFDASDTYGRVYTRPADNYFGYEANVDAKLYSNINFSQGDFSDMNAILGTITDNLGFDLTANYKTNLFRFLSVGGQARIPIAPSKLSLCSAVEYKYKDGMSLDDLISSSNSENSEDVPEEQNPDDAQEESSGFDFNSMIKDPVVLENPYSIHRPLKLGITADFHPFGTLLSTRGYAGIGVRHPFAKTLNSDAGSGETKVYFDYSVTGRLSLWNVISLELTHEHMDEVYKNQLALMLNIRLVEVDAGVSFQSTNFTQSFKGAGAGAFVTVCIGL